MRSVKRDLVRMRDGVRRLCDLARHKAIAAIAIQVHINEAGRSLDDIRDERQVDEWLQTRCTDYVHAVGTCRMGIDERSVVASRTEVMNDFI